MGNFHSTDTPKLSPSNFIMIDEKIATQQTKYVISLFEGIDTKLNKLDTKLNKLLGKIILT